MLKHTNQYDFSKLGIKDNEGITEDSLNIPNTQLKKESDDAYNFISIFAGLEPIEYNSEIEYQKNEIVTYGNKNYISLKKTQGNTPTILKNSTKVVNSKYWKLFDDFSRSSYIQKLSNFLSKNNQTEYEPNHLEPEEYTIDYHPATVKFVQDRINYHLKNSVIKEAKRLDGFRPSHFALQENIAETKKLFEEMTGNRLLPYTIPFSIEDMNIITKTENFEEVLSLSAFETLYKEIQLRVDLRFGTNQNKVVSYKAYIENDVKTIELNILGPFKGFGCEPDDWTCGQVFLKITNDMGIKATIESNCSRQITPHDYANLTNKSEYVVYVMTNEATSQSPMFFQNSDIYVDLRNILYTYPNRDVIVKKFCICNANTYYIGGEYCGGNYGCSCNTQWSQGCTNHFTDVAYTSCRTNIEYNCPANLNGSIGN